MESKSEWSITDAKNYCQQAISRYLFQLNSVQQEVFNAMKEEETSSSFKFLDTQITLGIDSNKNEDKCSEMSHF